MRRRAAPPLAVEVRRHSLWRAGLILLASAWALTWTAWVAGHHGVFAAVATGMACAAASWWLLRGHLPARPTLLRWDGQCWHWRTREMRHEIRGRAEVHADLGTWLLLRLVPADAASRPQWLPVQRGGLERHWHDLRCAVYSPTPDAAPPADPTSSTA
jgi:hypothetical protein